MLLLALVSFGAQPAGWPERVRVDAWTVRGFESFVLAWSDASALPWWSGGAGYFGRSADGVFAACLDSSGALALRSTVPESGAMASGTDAAMSWTGDGFSVSSIEAASPVKSIERVAPEDSETRRKTAYVLYGWGIALCVDLAFLPFLLVGRWARRLFFSPAIRA
jgi:hypothetical protein